jgi:ribonuclease P protein component
MIGRKKRLNRDAFKKIFSAGTRYHSPVATLIHSEAPTAQIAVVVSKKVVRTAIGRNKLRRRVYNNMRDTNKGIFIFIMKPQAAKLTYNELTQEIQKLTSKVKNTR